MLQNYMFIEKEHVRIVKLQILNLSISNKIFIFNYLKIEYNLFIVHARSNRAFLNDWKLSVSKELTADL